MASYSPAKLTQLMLALGALTFPLQSFASAFQLFEQDAASLGDYHAGYAAEAADASTNFYNPAGLTRIQNQQLVFAGAMVATSFKYQGNLGVSSIDSGTPQTVTAQGGNLGFIPALHYATPLTNHLAFGFSVDVPFGLKTYYGNNTILRYASTQTSVQVIDYSPSLAYQIANHWSVGAGLDVQSMQAEFEQVGVVFSSITDTDGMNNVDDTAYGYHAGVLYAPTKTTRYGLSYHSQVVHHLTGTSTFSGPLADLLVGHPVSSNTARVNITLPPYTAFSVYHELNPQYTVLGSIIYTQWKTLQYLTLQNVAAIQDANPSTSVVIVVPQHFRNTLNYALGLEDKLTDKIKVRGGLGFDVTPVKNAYRNVQMPDNNRYIIALGGHLQATKTIGLDVAWDHIFMNKAHVNPPAQQTGDEIITTDGSVKGGADVYAAQVTWDL
jgi:long-chain fatty acid transport protein